MLKIISAEFVKGAVKSSQFPQIGVPEFAFFGRSNVGKSSLINTLLNRKNLVKTGARPGMTREINFFIVNSPTGVKCRSTGKPLSQDKDKKGSGSTGQFSMPSKTGIQTAGQVFCIADLPGYGFAQVSDSVRNRIDRMLYDYCTVRSELKTIFFLWDIRREPSEVEQRILTFFREQGIETVLTATKTDKIGKNEQMQRRSALATFFECNKDSIVLTSASKKTGREMLLQHIFARVNG